MDPKMRIAQALRDVYTELYQATGIGPMDFARLVASVLREAIDKACWPSDDGGALGWVRAEPLRPDTLWRIVKDFADEPYGYIAPDLWGRMYPGMQQMINVLALVDTEREAREMVRALEAGR